MIAWAWTLEAAGGGHEPAQYVKARAHVHFPFQHVHFPLSPNTPLREVPPACLTHASPTGDSVRPQPRRAKRESTDSALGTPPKKEPHAMFTPLSTPHDHKSLPPLALCTPRG